VIVEEEYADRHLVGLPVLDPTTLPFLDPARTSPRVEVSAMSDLTQGRPE
jgi:hypothetical protein